MPRGFKQPHTIMRMDIERVIDLNDRSKLTGALYFYLLYYYHYGFNHWFYYLFPQRLS